MGSLEEGPLGFAQLKKLMDTSIEKAVCSVNSTSSWDECFEELILFQKEHGHCKVSQRYHPGRLARWVSKQRSLYKNGRLTKECVQKLDDIGFIWCGRIETRIEYELK
jgi:Helicase associated domain